MKAFWLWLCDLRKSTAPQICLRAQLKKSSQKKTFLRYFKDSNIKTHQLKREETLKRCWEWEENELAYKLPLRLKLFAIKQKTSNEDNDDGINAKEKINWIQQLHENNLVRSIRIMNLLELHYINFYASSGVNRAIFISRSFFSRPFGAWFWFSKLLQTLLGNSSANFVFFIILFVALWKAFCVCIMI